MQSITVALFGALVALLPMNASAGDSAKQKPSVTVHLETDAADNPKFIFPHEIGSRTRYFRRSPEISTKDVLAYSPYPLANNNLYGAVFKLKGRAANRLASITSSNQGRWLITAVNGRVVDGVVIDQRIEDGIFVAWDGLTLADIAVLDDEIPRIGDDGKKKKN